MVDGKNGLFVSAPSKKNEKDGKWYDEVRMPEELRDKLQERALNEYGGGEVQPDSLKHPF